MKIPALLLLMLVFLGSIGLSQAVPPGLSLEFTPEDQGVVTFSGTAHYEAGLRCSNCHMRVFHVSRSARISFRHHRSDQYCFGCHDGEEAFGIRRNCGNCHEGG